MKKDKEKSPDDRLFRMLVEAVSDFAIFMIDKDGFVQTWNQGARRFKGYEAGEILGKHFSVFYPDKDREMGLPERALDIAAREGRFEQEGWRVRKDGARIWAHVVIDPIFTESGELVGFAKITRDISDRRLAQRELRKSEERFRLLVQSVTDYAIYMLNTDGVVVSWNRGAQRFKGYSEHEIIGQHFSRFYSEEDRKSGLPARALATALSEGRFEHEGWRIRKDGSRMWAFVIIDPIRDDDGELIGFAKITRDLTERKAAQDALRLSEERFRILVQGVKEYAIYMLDTHGRIANWNAGAERLKGYSEHEIVGQHFSTFYPEEDRKAGLPQRAIDTAAREGRYVHEGWRVRKDGGRFWADVTIDAIRDESGELIGFAKITRDVSDRKAAEQALEESRSQLLQSQKLQSIGQLTGGIAHDFNNLLSVVLGNLNLVLKRLPDDRRMRELVRNSIAAADRGAALTQRLLAFARRQELSVQLVEIPQLVRNMADLLQRSLGSSVQVNTHFPLGLSPALIDANQLELALLNLCVNARDAMPKGGTVQISAREMTLTREASQGLKPGRYVCVSVADDGEGMDRETLSRAVEPFFTTKGVGRGTGLGLSMIHGFASQSGGRLDIESEPGVGTKVSLYLPAADAIRQREAAVEAAPEPQAPADASLCVLVVDDDPLVLMNTSAMLQDVGHHVLEASTGEQALQILRKTPHIDLVITDEVMPYMRGVELIGRIRADWPEMPVILATGYSEAPAPADLNAGRLAKPFSQQTLADAVTAAIESRRSSAHVIAFRGK